MDVARSWDPVFFLRHDDSPGRGERAEEGFAVHWVGVGLVKWRGVREIGG